MASLVSLIMLVGVFGLALFLLKALGWVIVTGFHLIGVFVLAVIVEASIVHWRRKRRAR